MLSFLGENWFFVRIHYLGNLALERVPDKPSGNFAVNVGKSFPADAICPCDTHNAWT
jgi:hypothetical protein